MAAYLSLCGGGARGLLLASPARREYEELMPGRTRSLTLSYMAAIYEKLSTDPVPCPWPSFYG